jgi:CHAT domain-containing protein
VLSNPRCSVSLDLDRECSKVEEALGRIPIRPEVLRQATRSKLLESICDGEHQIFHFMGHGAVDPLIGEGVLVLEDEYGGQDFLQASTLASFFTGKPMPRLVVLASCSSAEPGRDPAFGPFASVAAALVAAGFPTVVAMQSEILDRSAIRFTERLYRRIVQGDPIEAAVSEARIALRAAQAETLDWAVPVLFVRGHTEGMSGREVSALLEPASSAERRDPLVSQVISQRDVDFQQNFGYVHEVHQRVDPKK